MMVFVIVVFVTFPTLRASTFGAAVMVVMMVVVMMIRSVVVVVVVWCGCWSVAVVFRSSPFASVWPSLVADAPRASTLV